MSSFRTDNLSSLNHFPLALLSPTLQLVLCFLPSSLRMVPQLNSLPAQAMGQDEVQAHLVHIPLNFPEMGTVGLTSNLHSVSGAPYSPFQVPPHPELSFLCFFPQLWRAQGPPGTFASFCVKICHGPLMPVLPTPQISSQLSHL